MFNVSNSTRIWWETTRTKIDEWIMLPNFVTCERGEGSRVDFPSPRVWPLKILQGTCRRLVGQGGIFSHMKLIISRYFLVYKLITWNDGSMETIRTTGTTLFLRIGTRLEHQRQSRCIHTQLSYLVSSILWRCNVCIMCIEKSGAVKTDITVHVNFNLFNVLWYISLLQSSTIVIYVIYL